MAQKHHGITHSAAISTHPGASLNEAKRLAAEGLNPAPITIDAPQTLAPIEDQPKLGPLVELSNVFSIGNLKFEALSDRLIILEDEFKTGYECSGCSGSGNIPCTACSTTGQRGVKKCSDCDGKGHLRCTTCGGKGGLLIAPQITERRPTTGKVVSAGPGKTTDQGTLIPMQIKLGESVMYSNFAGYVVDLERAGQPICLRILHESEILCRMEGHLTLSNLKGKSEIATFQS